VFAGSLRSGAGPFGFACVRPCIILLHVLEFAAGAFVDYVAGVERCLGLE